MDPTLCQGCIPALLAHESKCEQGGEREEKGGEEQPRPAKPESRARRNGTRRRDFDGHGTAVRRQ